MSENIERVGGYAKNDSLESLLKEINASLSPASESLKQYSQERFSKIFLMGAQRSGTTLFMQWLASSGLVGYPTNLLSRFYGAPLIGAKIQQLLTDPRYNFRNEIVDFNSEITFSSENGKTRGALAPNEFWYFWRRFLPFDELDYLEDDELSRQGDLSGLRDELNALANIFEKPFAMKGMIMNQNIPSLDGLFGKALFIWIKRDPVFNIQSALEARRRQYGNIDTWYSFKIKQYPELKHLEPLESVAGQIHAINTSIETALQSLPEQKKLIIEYEDFCRRPADYYAMIVDKLKEQQGLADAPDYAGEKAFSHTNRWRLEEYSQEQARLAYQRYSPAE